MARGRPFGVWAYSFGPYSRWHGVAIELTLIGRGAIKSSRLMLPLLHLVGARIAGRSSVDAELNIRAVLHLSGSMEARGGLYAPLRLFWEHEPPPECGDDWSPGESCVVEWTQSVACDVAWVVQPKPPYACPDPEVIHG